MTVMLFCPLITMHNVELRKVFLMNRTSWNTTSKRSLVPIASAVAINAPSVLTPTYLPNPVFRL